MLKLERILLPTDFSDASLQAGEYACELASRFGAAVDVLFVLESPAVAMPSPEHRCRRSCSLNGKDRATCS